MDLAVWLVHLYGLCCNKKFDNLGALKNHTVIFDTTGTFFDFWLPLCILAELVLECVCEIQAIKLLPARTDVLDCHFCW